MSKSKAKNFHISSEVTTFHRGIALGFTCLITSAKELVSCTTSMIIAGVIIHSNISNGVISGSIPNPVTIVSGVVQS